MEDRYTKKQERKAKYELNPEIVKSRVKKCYQNDPEIKRLRQQYKRRFLTLKKNRNKETLRCYLKIVLTILDNLDEHCPNCG
jgi:hypothetical protein